MIVEPLVSPSLARPPFGSQTSRSVRLRSRLHANAESVLIAGYSVAFRHDSPALPRVRALNRHSGDQRYKIAKTISGHAFTRSRSAIWKKLVAKVSRAGTPACRNFWPQTRWRDRDRAETWPSEPGKPPIDLTRTSTQPAQLKLSPSYWFDLANVYCHRQMTRKAYSKTYLPYKMTPARNKTHTISRQMIRDTKQNLGYGLSTQKRLVIVRYHWTVSPWSYLSWRRPAYLIGANLN